MNITDLDPLKYGLLFERFLNPDRISMPDIDVDIQDTRRDWKGIATLGATFFGTIALGFILMPKDAPEFWFSALTNPSRVGGLNFVDNVSIQGWLLHFGLSESAAKPVYYALALVTMLGLMLAIGRFGQTLLRAPVGGQVAGH